MRGTLVDPGEGHCSAQSSILPEPLCALGFERNCSCRVSPPIAGDDHSDPRNTSLLGENTTIAQNLLRTTVLKEIAISITLPSGDWRRAELLHWWMLVPPGVFERRSSWGES